MEIVTAAWRWPSPPVATVPQPAVGKRPLSSFAPEPIVDLPAETAALAEPTFHPETTISAFRWPQVCRALWERYAEQYEHIAEMLLAHSGRESGRGDIVGVGALHAGDGATTTLLCLAVAIAAQQRSVILVDANFRAPRLAGLLGVQPSTSWQDVLEQGLPVAEAVIRAEHDGVDLLPLDLRAPHSPRTERRPAGHGPANFDYRRRLAVCLRNRARRSRRDSGAPFVQHREPPDSQHADRVGDRRDRPETRQADDFTVAGELLDETGCELLGLIENRTNIAALDSRRLPCIWNIGIFRRSRSSRSRSAPVCIRAKPMRVALMKLRYAIENQRGAALLAGPAGTGKTTLTRMLEAQLDARFSPFVRLVFPQMSSRDLLVYLAEELGAPPADPPRHTVEESVRRLEFYLAQNSHLDRHAVVVVDEAHLLEDCGALETLRLLLNFEVDSKPTFSLLLVGQMGLVSSVTRLPSLAERVAVSSLLRAFTAEETAGYVQHRLRRRPRGKSSRRMPSKQFTTLATAFRVRHQAPLARDTRVARVPFATRVAG